MALTLALSGASPKVNASEFTLWQQLLAVSNGSSDATLAVTNYINANAGSNVQFPAGKFVISGTIEIPSNTAIVGSGRGQTFFLASPSMSKSTIFGFGTVASPASSSSLSHLTVNGQAAGYMPAPNAAGVYIPAGANSDLVQDVAVLNVGFNGIGVHGNGDQVTGCTIYNNYGDGINMTGDLTQPSPVATTGNLINNNTIQNNALAGTNFYAVNCGSMASNCTIHNNSITGNGVLVYDNGQYDSGDSGNSVTDNSIVSSDQFGVAVAGYESGFLVRNNTIVGPSMAGWGVSLSGPVSSGQVSGNQVGRNNGNEPAQGGITLNANSAGAPSSITVNANMIVYPAGTQAIQVASGCSNITLRNNTETQGS
jgi:hypothetical protein